MVHWQNYPGTKQFYLRLKITVVWLFFRVYFDCIKVLKIGFVMCLGV